MPCVFGACPADPRNPGVRSLGPGSANNSLREGSSPAPVSVTRLEKTSDFLTREEDTKFAVRGHE